MGLFTYLGTAMATVTVTIVQQGTVMTVRILSYYGIKMGDPPPVRYFQATRINKLIEHTFHQVRI